MTPNADESESGVTVYLDQWVMEQEIVVYYWNSAGSGEATEEATSEATAAPEEGGTIRLHLLRCDDGVIPEEGTVGNCTYIPDNGRGEVFIDGVTTPLLDYPQDESGAYVTENITGVSISGSGSDDGWKIQMSADEIHGDSNVYTIDPGEVRDVFVYYTPPE